MKLLNNRRFSNTSNGLGPTTCLAFVLSVLTMIGSIWIIGFGIRALVEVAYLAPIIGSHFIIYGPCCLIMIGIFAFGMTPIGFYSIIMSNSEFMVLNMFGTFFLSGLCVSSGYLGYSLNTKMNYNLELESWMNRTMIEEFDNPNTPDIREAWNKVQQQYSCCGVESNRDWVKSVWFAKQKLYPRLRYPESCCASCASMHDRFCTSFFGDVDGNQPLSKNQTICLQASKKCESADESIANKYLCSQNSVEIKNFYRHENGCLGHIRFNVNYFSNRVFIYSIIFFFILFSSTLTWFAVHELIDPIRVRINNS
ncbi:unnamed protein product [Caenorhabditis angaria]|uniref:Tetraspanin n=1 Tax=Caenorhabditis angaria TaxID=860376 RepID=A0A9P1J0Y7_9PELO|nr:unnamed protein product [Caenorhabditis angaria]